ncbi:ROK family [Acididesulfobacillus acetoxydans]|uniref:Glucokinase n=1 Tax=Acididesulfobacillus acetoxydans TaxID=1561005 RepID=A0A8S0WLI4_9FIRM|nr:ROK family protein [Acididesulfobacillus acetoxydans]CAA7600014.1 ROK family [Acididesulfobacillus acetoxydans]CEJ06000.1 Glucokinase [Acididesulfobacillus acetoxydans]
MGRENSQQHHIGIDVGGTNIVYAVADQDGNLLREKKEKTRPERGADGILGELATQIREWTTEDPRIGSVGIGLPAVLDAEHGIARECVNLGWYNVDVIHSLKIWDLGLPVYLENDVRCVALAEKRYGAAASSRNAICLALGTGVGAGIFVEGKLLRGASGGAGEAGHIVVVPFGGERCACGGSGCLETVASAGAVVRQAGQALRHALAAGEPTLLREPLSGRVVSEAAAAGDRIAREVLAEAGRFLGVGLVTLVNLFEPECVVIGGGMALAGESLLAPAREIVRMRAMAYVANRVKIVPAQLGDLAGVIGAASLGMPDVSESRSSNL